MRQQPVISPTKNGFLYLHEVRAYRDGYSDATLLDILKGCKKYNATTLVVETNFGDGIVSELFKKHLQQTKQRILVDEVRANVRKKTGLLIRLNLFLTSTVLLLTVGLLSGITAQTKTVHLKVGSYICSFTR